MYLNLCTVKKKTEEKKGFRAKLAAKYKQTTAELNAEKAKANKNTKKK